MHLAVEIKKEITAKDFAFDDKLDSPLWREAMILTTNARKTLAANKEKGWEAVYGVEKSVRQAFIELGVPKALYDQLVMWDRMFWKVLNDIEAENPGTVGPTVRD